MGLDIGAVNIKYMDRPGGVAVLTYLVEALV